MIEERGPIGPLFIVMDDYGTSDCWYCDHKVPTGMPVMSWNWLSFHAKI